MIISMFTDAYKWMMKKDLSSGVYNVLNSRIVYFLN